MTLNRTDSNIVNRFFDRFIPAVRTAGIYALRIQHQIDARQDKTGDAWTSVITDADLGVQHFFETIMLADFPEWCFFGEEHAASFNTPYFRQSSVTVWLDPINGTRLYRDGADSFDILLSLSIDGRLVATLSFMPGKNIIYAASVCHRAFQIDFNDGDQRHDLDLKAAPMSLAIYQADQWRHQLPASVEIFDLIKDYSAADPRCCMNSVLTGQLGGFLFGDVALLDVGATAYTVTRAGGIACLPDGSSFDYFERFSGERRGDLLVCGNAALADIIAQSLTI